MINTIPMVVFIAKIINATPLIYTHLGFTPFMENHNFQGDRKHEVKKLIMSWSLMKLQIPTFV